MTYYLVLLDRNEYVESYDRAKHSVSVTGVKEDAKRFMSALDAGWIADRVAGFVEEVNEYHVNETEVNGNET